MNIHGADVADLNECQREAVTWGDGPVLILAGAGSGKTRVITYRIAHLLAAGIGPWNILAVTFTNKAAAEMRERVYKLTGGRGAGVWVSTFHSFAARFLRTEGQFFGIDKNFTIYDEEDQKKVLKECLLELGLDEKKLSLGTLAGKISREKDQLIDAESFAITALISNDPSLERFASIYSLYQKKLDRASAYDFGDLIMKTVELLRLKPPLREKYQERFRYILVDEYQDTNHAQYSLIKILAAKYKNICVVGDDDQSIYSWRGADIRNILEFEKDYTDVKVIKLEQNYRSTQPILNAAWMLVQNNKTRKDKKLWTERLSHTPVTAKVFENELMEADWIADKISGMKETSGAPLSSFAVFYRTNAQSRVLEDALRSSQVPYKIVGGLRFYERAEVKDVLAYLKALVNPKDDVSIKRIINFPPRGIGKTSLEKVEEVAAKFSISLFAAMSHEEALKSLTPRARESLGRFKAMIEEWTELSVRATVFEMVKIILDKTNILGMLKEESATVPESGVKLDNVQELMNAAEEFVEKADTKSAASYLEHVSLMTGLDLAGEKQDCVTLMTVHIAKGLEFPVVFLTGLEEGLFPLGEAQFSLDELEEERRIAYVGMTRAKDVLFLTCASTRRLFGQIHWNMPSRFIREAGLSEEVRKPAPGEERIRMDLRAGGTNEWSGKEETTHGFTHSINTEDPGSAFKIGQKVRHPVFGNGKITQKSGSDDDLKVVVLFDSGQWKKLLVKYAPLEKIH